MAKGQRQVMLLCCVKWGMFTWEDSDHIDLIQRAHGQKYMHPGKASWVKNGEVTRKPCSCKNYQMVSCSYNKDHGTNGKVHRHICAQCLTLRKQLNHPERDCVNKKNGSKNEVMTVHC